jgi:hypothetical protein
MKSLIDASFVYLNSITIFKASWVKRTQRTRNEVQNIQSNQEWNGQRNESFSQMARGPNLRHFSSSCQRDICDGPDSLLLEFNIKSGY